MLIYKEKLGDEVEVLASRSGLRGLMYRGAFICWVDRQKTGVRVKLDYVDASTLTPETFDAWEQALRERFGDLVIRVQRAKGTFDRDSAGRWLGGNAGTTVRVRFKDEVREFVQ